MLKQYIFPYRGYIGAALILGGVNVEGPHLYQIYPHGSSGSLPSIIMGSGSLASMSVLNEEAEIQLVRNVIAAGVFNDLGSGYNRCLHHKNRSPFYRRTYDEANKKGIRQASFRYLRGTTSVLSTKHVDVEEGFVQRIEPERIDTV